MHTIKLNILLEFTASVNMGIKDDFLVVLLQLSLRLRLRHLRSPPQICTRQNRMWSIFLRLTLIWTHCQTWLWLFWICQISCGRASLHLCTNATPLSEWIKNSKNNVNKYCPKWQNCRRSSVEECIFDYMALHIKCKFNKNSLHRSYF